MIAPILLSCISISWIISSLIINLIQLLLYITIKPLNRRLFRLINYYITYSSWSQVIALSEYWGGFRVRIFFKDEMTKSKLGKENTIAIANHYYELDWLFFWTTMDKYKFLANCKAFAKSSIKYLPCMGWSWWFNEFTFLKRNAAKDTEIIIKSLNNFKEYVDPVIMIFYPEGTRFTPEKHENSIKYAKEHSIEPFKYHLIPRAKGFSICMKHIKGLYEYNNNLMKESGDEKSEKNISQVITSIYNIQLAINEDKYKRSELNFLSAFKRIPIVADVYIERIPLESIDSSSDEKLNEFLLQIFREKDKLMDYHKENDKFPGIQVNWPEPKLEPGLNLVFWAILINSTVIYALIDAIIMGKTMLAASIAFSLLLIGLIVFLILQSTLTKHASNYGSTNKKAK